MSRLIDLLVKAAKELNAENQPVRLSAIEKRASDLDIDNHFKRSSYSATLNFHTVNMQSRFSDPKNPKKKVLWITEPYFTRTDPGMYKLLNKNELEIFNKAINSDTDLVYRSSYDFNDLKDQPNITKKDNLISKTNNINLINLLISKKQLILYGSPGTGKTYNTREIAVNLIEYKNG
jgi:Cdc6-like AAA superfamily ATPase